ncbi:MAG: hypothetical protein KDC44_21955, partial [Phaeodactylibacter sp.]|nr:hypothetical protein [Phaeodactylibacter sp.]
ILTGLDTPTPTVDAGGTYTLTATNTENGCVNSSEVTITQDQVAPTVDPGLDGLLNCFNPAIQLDGSASSTGLEFSYTWTTLGGNIVNNATTVNPTIDGPGLYILQLT